MSLPSSSISHPYRPHPFHSGIPTSERRSQASRPPMPRPGPITSPSGTSSGRPPLRSATPISPGSRRVSNPASTPTPQPTPSETVSGRLPLDSPPANPGTPGTTATGQAGASSTPTPSATPTPPVQTGPIIVNGEEFIYFKYTQQLWNSNIGIEQVWVRAVPKGILMAVIALIEFFLLGWIRRIAGDFEKTIKSAPEPIETDEINQNTPDTQHPLERITDRNVSTPHKRLVDFFDDPFRPRTPSTPPRGLTPPLPIPDDSIEMPATGETVPASDTEEEPAVIDTPLSNPLDTPSSPTPISSEDDEQADAEFNRQFLADILRSQTSSDNGQKNGWGSAIKAAALLALSTAAYFLFR